MNKQQIAGPLFGRTMNPIGVDNHDAPIPQDRTFVPRADGSMLSSQPLQPEAQTARNQPGFHASVGHLRARERAHDEARLSSAGDGGDPSSPPKAVMGVGMPAFLIFGGAMAVLYALSK